ncbi:MAG: hypothetical protein K2I49_00540, partial [Ureaplasma sp.]|nr:hypothetical protein [Ureaplasma sp.]
MKNFRLLLKNSIKSLWNSKGLVLQFTALTTIATVVISSVSLGNFSLRNAMEKVTQESNATGFSIENKSVDDFTSYNIINNSQKILDSIDSLSVSDASNNLIKVYNPLNNWTTTSTTLTVDGINYETYGFLNTYLNNNYTTSQESQKWKNIAFSKNNESLSIVYQNTPDKYQTELADIFTLYENILPPSPSEVESSKYEILFNENIYSFNPWSLFIDENNQMKANNFGFAKVSNFNSENDINSNISFNHGVFDILYSFIVGTNLTFLDESEMSKYSKQINTINSEVSLSQNYSNLYANNWKQLSSTTGFSSDAEFNDFLRKWFPVYAENYINNYFPTTYFNFLNVLSDDIKNKFMQDTKTFKLNYSIDVEKSSGISEFFGDIYLNPENEYYPTRNQIFNQESKKYFSGTFEVPLIPFITVLPLDNKLTLEQTREWASDYKNYTDPN